jgi:hypothetical protein
MCPLDYTTFIGAASPDDFIATSIEATIGATSPRHCIAIPIVPDYIYEQTEGFMVNLEADVPSYITIQPALATVLIQHRDSKLQS